MRKYRIRKLRGSWVWIVTFKDPAGIIHWHEFPSWRAAMAAVLLAIKLR